jgi:hypothetical protein
MLVISWNGACIKELGFAADDNSVGHVPCQGPPIKASEMAFSNLTSPSVEFYLSLLGDRIHPVVFELIHCAKGLENLYLGRQAGFEGKIQRIIWRL